MTVVHPSSRKTFAAVLRVVDGTSLWQSGKSKKAQVKAIRDCPMSLMARRQSMSDWGRVCKFTFSWRLTRKELSTSRQNYPGSGMNERDVRCRMSDVGRNRSSAACFFFIHVSKSTSYVGSSFRLRQYRRDREGFL